MLQALCPQLLQAVALPRWIQLRKVQPASSILTVTTDPVAVLPSNSYKLSERKFCYYRTSAITTRISDPTSETLWVME